ncbi:MAG: potassium channel family protein [Candidatus Micrarchaeota archaeon]|nr:potassium channel family protein [Candidatus Micrarchaeota archaeon]
MPVRAVHSAPIRRKLRQSLDIQSYIDLELEIQREKVRKKITYALLMLFSVYLISIFVFHTLEGWSWEDSIYFTTATITTVGYGDFVPQSYYGKLFTIPLMLIGVGVGFYVIFALQDYGKVKLSTIAKKIDHVTRRSKQL